MKRFVKGAVYYVSECRKGKAIYAQEFAQDPNFKINGHDAMRNYGIIWNRPCIMMQDIDFGGSFVTVLPLSSSDLPDDVDPVRPQIILDHHMSGNPLGCRTRPIHDTTTFVMLDRVQSVHVSDVFSIAGFIEPEMMESIDRCLKYIMGYGEKPAEWALFEEKRAQYAERQKQLQSQNESTSDTIAEPEVNIEEPVPAVSHPVADLGTYKIKRTIKTVKEVIDTAEEAEDSEEILNNESSSIPSYNIENRKVLSVPVDTVLPNQLVKECSIDNRSFEIFERENLTVAQYVSLATIPDSLIAGLLDITLGAATQVRNSAINICERVIDFGKVVYPRNMLRKHKIIFALADHEFIRKSSARLIAGRYGISSKKAHDFEDLAKTM
nr:MAG TPA: endoribonuclease [Caudoviricetes sp.]